MCVCVCVFEVRPLMVGSIGGPDVAYNTIGKEDIMIQRGTGGNCPTSSTFPELGSIILVFQN